MEPTGKADETIENKRKRLIFRADHRGTKEMDLLLGSFAKKYVPEFDEQELAEFDQLLSHNDPDLYNWITGKEEVPEAVVSLSIFETLRSHKLS